MKEVTVSIDRIVIDFKMTTQDVIDLNVQRLAGVSARFKNSRPFV